MGLFPDSAQQVLAIDEFLQPVSKTVRIICQQIVEITELLKDVLARKNRGLLHKP